MTKTVYWIVASLLLIAVSLLLWLSDPKAGQLHIPALTSTQVEPLHQGQSFPLTLTDPIGQQHRLDKAPQRIVSATLASDEMLAALVEQQRVVGVTSFVDNPTISNVAGHYSADITRINGTIEEIIALQPDLVFVSGFSRAETVRLLLNAGIPVIRFTGFSAFKQLEDNLLLTATVTGTSKTAGAIIAANQAKLDKIEATYTGQARPRVLYYNLNGSSAGSETLINEIIERAGGINALQETSVKGFEKISEELAISLNPDLIIVSGWSEKGQSPSEALKQRVAWQHITAVRNNRVYSLRGNSLFAVSQFSWRGVEQLALLLHPELFTPVESYKDRL